QSWKALFQAAWAGLAAIASRNAVPATIVRTGVMAVFSVGEVRPGVRNRLHKKPAETGRTPPLQLGNRFHSTYSLFQRNPNPNRCNVKHAARELIFQSRARKIVTTPPAEPIDRGPQGYVWSGPVGSVCPGTGRRHAGRLQRR